MQNQFCDNTCASATLQAILYVEKDGVKIVTKGGKTDVIPHERILASWVDVSHLSSPTTTPQFRPDNLGWVVSGPKATLTCGASDAVPWALQVKDGFTCCFERELPPPTGGSSTIRFVFGSELDAVAMRCASLRAE